MGSVVSAGVAGLSWYMSSPAHADLGAPAAFLTAFFLTLIGWSLVLRKALADASDGSSQGDVSKDCLALVQVETQAVIECLTAEFQKQFQYADQELSQTQDLLKDAIDTLTASFTGIYGSVDAITQGVRQTTVEAEKSSEETARIIEKLPGIASQLEIDINTAIRTLQFQDLTTQLIDHAAHRIAAMNNALSDLKSMSGGKPCDSVSLIVHLKRRQESIRQYLANLDEHKTNPVSQGHMGIGEIELF